MRKLPGNWTFLLVTDRTDLDDQIYKNFARAGVVTEPEKRVRAQSGEHLQQLLREDHRYLFTLIQKFRTRRDVPSGRLYPELSGRPDIIVMTDEAHRSQYDILAMNMRLALPNAAFLAFTATSTVYLDRPMRNHTLMQTIARANRVWGGKVNGLIVDYVGMFRDLQRALAIYGTGPGGEIVEGEEPVEDKAAFVERLREAIAAAEEFCTERGVDLQPILHSQGFQRIALMDDAVEQVIVNDDLKIEYLGLAGEVDRLFKAILPDTRAAEFGPKRKALVVLGDKIRSLAALTDISGLMPQVEDLLDESVEAKEYVIREAGVPYDLSKIDFEALMEQFRLGRKRTEAEKLRGGLNVKLQRMVRLNHSRMDYLEAFQKLIDEYNAGSRNVEQFFDQLVGLAQQLNQEEQRAVAENLSEEELAVFDLLTRPDLNLTAKEKGQVKAIARELLEALKWEKLVLDWRKRQHTRAAVRVAIEDMVWQLPERYSDEMCQEKSALVYQHVYDNYWGARQSVYARVA